MNKSTLPHHHAEHSTVLQYDLPSGQAFEMMADVFKIMSDAKRVQLFWLLCHCEECVVNLSALMDMSSSALSHHLKLLKTTGFVVSRREGKEVFYTAAPTEKTKMLHEMMEKVCEVSCPGEEIGVDSHEYDANVNIILQVHDFLVQDICSRHTIEELSRRFSINQTTLKTAFKAVYGQPVASYMKDYRIKKAKELLLHTDSPIAEIASRVGYENQSKFTQAFKEVTGMLPKEYRKTRSEFKNQPSEKAEG